MSRFSSPRSITPVARLNLIRIARADLGLIPTRSVGAALARFVMQLHMQPVQCAIRFVDRPVQRIVLVEPQHFEPSPATMNEVEHRPDSVPERRGLLGCQMSAHADSVYGYINEMSRIRFARSG